MFHARIYYMNEIYMNTKVLLFYFDEYLYFREPPVVLTMNFSSHVLSL